MCGDERLPFFEYVADIVTDDNVYWEHCQAKTCKKDGHAACRPDEIVASDETWLSK